ncbi:hypothetical protein [Oceanobacter mangrovi]|uniref:hypothetical protein n=1 Tax=Oceanobacter mangrovi TaxID=2862510 RepID=UPI001C8EC6C8|nr:hypothetical protein [Oceanobacter mangrovi]
MRELQLNFDSAAFNMLWRSLAAREKELLSIVENNDEESDEAIDAANDIIALRLFQIEVKSQAEGIFSDNVFSLSNEYL